MKKCPHCKAEIQENARFCLYCMTSLDEKKPVSQLKRRKPFLLIGAAVLLAVLILVLSCCVGREAREELGSMTPDEAVMQQPGEKLPEETAKPAVSHTEPQSSEQPESTAPEIPPSSAQTEQNAPRPTQSSGQTQNPQKPTQPTTTEPSEPDAPVTTPAICTHRYQLTQTQGATCTADGSNTYTCSLCGDSYREAISATGHSNQAATCVLPQVCTVCGSTGSAALGHSYRNGTCIRCEEPDPNDPRNVYAYQAVGAGDQLDAGTWDPETDIIITGVKQIADDGVYEIPSYLNGKRVVAISPLAFSGTDARQVTLGENIIYVSQNAFSGCYNIEALYVRSDYLYLSRSAFIPASSRKCTLRIYCSAECTVDDALKGECYLRDIVRAYGGEYHEWNG